MKTLKRIFCSTLIASGLIWSLSAEAAPKEYEGEVMPIATIAYQAGTNESFYGVIDYIAREGQIVTPPVTDNRDNVLIEGDFIYRMNKRFWQSMVDQSKAAMETSKIEMELAKKEFDRYEKLSSSNADSLQTAQDKESLYMTAVNNYWQAEAAYYMNMGLLQACDNYAPFEGQVTSVTMITGTLPGWPVVATVEQLNPIIVTVKMPRNEAKAIRLDTPVKVIPFNSDKQMGILNAYTMLSPDGVKFAVENFPVIKGSEVIKDNSMPVTRKWIAVENFHLKKVSDVLGVPTSSIVKEGDKCFVWRGKGQKTMSPDKGIDYQFPIEKVYVKPLDLHRYVDNSVTITALEDKGSLEINDIVLAYPAKGLKEGQTVIFPDEAYLLMPGDKVKVIVGN